LAGVPCNCASRNAAVSNGNNTGTGLRPMPAKIGDVTAFSWTSAGNAWGSNAGGRCGEESANDGAAGGWLPISDES
jgi:hypothetical protein